MQQDEDDMTQQQQQIRTYPAAKPRAGLRTARGTGPAPELRPGTGPASIPVATEAPTPAPVFVPPATPEEARVRYFKRWAPDLLAAFFGRPVDEPETIEQWIALAEATREIVKAREAAAALLEGRS